MSDFSNLLSNFTSAIGGPAPQPSNSKRKLPTETTTTTKPLTLPRKTKPKTQIELNRFITQKMYDINAIRSSLSKIPSPPALPTANSNCSKQNLAICMVIVDSLPHEEIWRSWSKGFEIDSTTKTQTVSFHIHAKHPSTPAFSPWVTSHLLPNNLTFTPNWNDVQVVRAMLSLSFTALLESTTTHIMFVTESCLPIVPFDQAYAAILNPDNLPTSASASTSASAFSSTPPPPYISCIPSFSSSSKKSSTYDAQIMNSLSHHGGFTPSSAIRKSLPGWICLSKFDARAILDAEIEAFGILNKLEGEGETSSLSSSDYNPLLDPKAKPYGLWPSFTGAWAPEELYFPTILSALNRLDDNKTSSRSLSYAVWNKESKKWNERANPDWLTLDVKGVRNWVDFGLNGNGNVNGGEGGKGRGCVFGRKFRKLSGGVREWGRVVYGSEGEEEEDIKTTTNAKEKVDSAN